MVTRAHSMEVEKHSAPHSILREHQDGRWELIFPVESMSAQEYAKQLLQDPGGDEWFAFADYFKGKPVLRIQGIEKKNDILPKLEQHHEPVTVRTLEQRGLKRKKANLSEKSLRLSGISEYVGDIAFMARGVLNKESRWDILTGGTYLGSSAILAKYGQQSRGKKLDNFAVSLRDYLQNQGVVFRQSEDEDMSYGISGLVEKVERYLQENPTQFRLITNMTGALMMLSGGVREYGKAVEGYQTDDSNANKLKQDSAIWRLGCGVVLCLTSVLALVLPENKKPLLISGAGGLASNIGLLVSGEKGRQAAKLDQQSQKETASNFGHQLTYLTSLSFMASNAFFAMSSKSGPAYASYERDTMAAIAAGMLAEEPDQISTPVLRKTAEHLSKRSGKNLSETEIFEQLNDKVEKLRRHPLLQHRMKQQEMGV